MAVCRKGAAWDGFITKWRLCLRMPAWRMAGSGGCGSLIWRRWCPAGRVVAMDEPLSYVAQFEFADRAAFERYVAEHAPRLRADGLKRFPADRVKYLRRTGQIIF